jgi:uncharacterized damage-inducible protein DinB
LSSSILFVLQPIEPCAEITCEVALRKHGEKMSNDQDLVRSVTTEAIASLNYGCEKIEHCLRQLDEEQLWWRPGPDMNAIGNLLLHLAGNLRQWIVAGVGDAVDTRERQREFDQREPIPKSQVWQRLAAVVEEAANVLRTVSADELMSLKRVQGNDVTKVHAMMHSVTHFQGHVQEIICLTRQQLGDKYELQWQPRTKEEGAA